MVPSPSRSHAGGGVSKSSTSVLGPKFGGALVLLMFAIDGGESLIPLPSITSHHMGVLLSAMLMSEAI